MTPEDIIKNNQWHSDWENIKTTNPDEYQRRSQNAILSKFENVLPYYLRWQSLRKIGGFNRYVKSIPCVIKALNALNFKEYERDINGKQNVTIQFYSKCISYGIEEIIKVSSNFDDYRALKIKNLINRSFKRFYSYRCEVVNNIVELLDWEENDINRLELLAYIPFQNAVIGIDWMLRHLNPTMSELLSDWLVLLSFDVDMFISDEFITKLKKSLGDEKVSRLHEKLLIHIAKSKTKHAIFNKIIKKHNMQIVKYKNLLLRGQIVEDITFNDISFSRENVCFFDCRMHIHPYLNQSVISCLKRIIDPTRLLTIYVENTTTKKGVHIFNPIFPMDMKYLMKSIKKARKEAVTIQDEDVKIQTTISIESTLNKEKETTRAQSTTQRISTTSGASIPDKDVKIQSATSIESTINKEKETIRIQSTTQRILATGVQAFNFKIREGVIEYKLNNKVYYLKSVKIPGNVSETILKKIEHTFTLVKDKSVPVNPLNNEKELRFYFEPANDLSLLLAEIKRLSTNTTLIRNENFPQSGEFELPWRYVQIYEGILILFHPNPSKRGTITPFHFRNSDIPKSFEDIRPYIENRSPKLRVRAVDGVVTNLLNFKEFMEVISQYKEREEEENIWIGQPIKANKSYCFSKETFIKNSKVRKSPYLAHLASIQHDDFKISYLLEHVIYESGIRDQDEYGYLFVLKKNLYSMVLLYENISDLSRSSILYFIHPDFYQESINEIRKFLASEITNKRQKLSYGQVLFDVPYIKDIKRVKHSNIIDWKYAINKYL